MLNDVTVALDETALLALEADGQRYEVADGDLIEVGMTGEQHGRIEFLLLLWIGNHVIANDLGMVYPGDTSFVLLGTPEKIILKREPDVAFVKKANLKATSGYLYQAPDLAVEIISPSQSYTFIRRKIQDYLGHGSSQVWIVMPETRQIEVHTPDGSLTTYDVKTPLPGGDLLPGFTLDLKQIFN